MRPMLLILASILVTSVAHAQAPAEEPPPPAPTESGRVTTSHLYFKAGPSFSTLTNSDISGITKHNKTALFFSLESNLPFNENFSFESAISYIQKGIAFSQPGVTNGVPFTANSYLNLNYLEFSLLMKATAHLGDSFAFSLRAGPFASLILSKSVSATADVRGETVDVPLNDPQVTQALNQVSSSDLGLKFGVVFEHRLSQMISWTLGVDYDLGLKGVSPADVGDTPKTRSLLASLGIGLNF